MAREEGFFKFFSHRYLLWLFAVLPGETPI